MILLAWCSLGSPAFYDYECEHTYLPSVERRFGFVGGRARVPGDDWTAYTLVRVDPEGVLGKAGFRSGDVPVAHHGGLAEFCAALQWSESAHDSFEVEVINIDDWDAGSRRRIVIPSLGG
jgi:hypothetical protein